MAPGERDGCEGDRIARAYGAVGRVALAIVGALSIASIGCTQIIQTGGSCARSAPAASCPAANERIAAREPAIADPNDAVVRVASRGGECTGTLIDPRLVLTSRNCLLRITATTSSEAVPRLFAELGGGVVPYRFANVVSIVGAPCLELVGLVLDDPLKAPPLKMRLGASVALGEPVRIIGFGNCGARPASMRAISLPGYVTGGAETTFDLDAQRCEGDAGAPIISDWTGEIVGVVLDDDKEARSAARLDVQSALLSRAWLESHGRRFSTPLSCE